MWQGRLEQTPSGAGHSMIRLSLLLFLLLAPLIARGDYREFRAVPVDAELSAKLARAAEASLKDFPKLNADNLSLSVIDLTRPDHIVRADYHGDAAFYPASLVKLFFMVETYHQGRITPEIERALREMIQVSDNDAAAFLVDVLTNTSSGSFLEGKALTEFIDRRRQLNRYFASLGYDISAMTKPWSSGPYGRDVQVLGEKLNNRNRASANSVASLLLWIVRRHAISAQASESMLALLNARLLLHVRSKTRSRISWVNHYRLAHDSGRKRATPVKSAMTPSMSSCPAEGSSSWWS